MRRVNSEEFEMSHDEIRKLWREIWGEDIPEEHLSLRSAAEAVYMTLGRAGIEEKLCRPLAKGS